MTSLLLQDHGNKLLPVVYFSYVTFLVPHAVSMILLKQKTSHLSTARRLRYITVLLGMSNITVQRCNVLNPASLFHTPEDEQEHNCVAILQQVALQDQIYKKHH